MEDIVRLYLPFVKAIKGKSKRILNFAILSSQQCYSNMTSIYIYVY